MPEPAGCSITYRVDAAADVDAVALSTALDYFSASTGGMIRFSRTDGDRALRFRVDGFRVGTLCTGNAACAELANLTELGAGTITFADPSGTRNVGLIVHEIGHLWLTGKHSDNEADLMYHRIQSPDKRFSAGELRVLAETARSEVRPPVGCSL